MEFTKKEQKILSPRHERMEKWTLWLGIIALCLSLALIPYAIYRINKLEKIWEFAHTYLKNEINTQTKKEIARHLGMATSSITRAIEKMVEDTG